MHPLSHRVSSYVVEANLVMASNGVPPIPANVANVEEVSGEESEGADGLAHADAYHDADAAVEGEQGGLGGEGAAVQQDPASGSVVSEDENAEPPYKKEVCVQHVLVTSSSMQLIAFSTGVLNG